MKAEAHVIGRGTWLDKVAAETVEREKRLRRDTSLVRVESGLGASGIPHIGSVGDAIRSYGVKLALETAGYRSELIAYSDDFDGLRKVPSGFPAWLKDYIAHPVSRIPDPFGCHSSYAEHVGSLLRESLDRLGIVYTFQSGSDAYRSGLLNEQTRKILSNAAIVGKKINELVGQSKYETNLPYTPVCKNCSRIYTTQTLFYDSTNDTVTYACKGTELGGRFLEGCGHEGVSKISDGNGKLMWKVEFAARWAAFGIRFEAYGKELTDSVKVNDWVSEHVLGYPPPFHARYELFQDKSGRKISKSVGNLLTPLDWLEYASPESLRLLMYKRIVGARNVSVEDIPVFMEDFDDLEEYYFSENRDPNVMRDSKQRGLYEYTMLLNVPKSKRIHVPYRLISQLASVAPLNAVHEFVSKRLVDYGMVKEESDELSIRIEWGARWASRVERPRLPPVKVGPRVSKALKEFAKGIDGLRTADEVQNVAFAALKGNGLKPSDFFPVVYSILLGSDRGPRLGPYVIDATPERVTASILAALKPGSGSKNQ
ncbi:MAG: lysine--tRNA ligase [Thaumarchaeota archaeon]|nr:lysine--tRNA ligase [Nitrososphaerota archaeon]